MSVAWGLLQRKRVSLNTWPHTLRFEAAALSDCEAIRFRKALNCTRTCERASRVRLLQLGWFANSPVRSNEHTENSRHRVFSKLPREACVGISTIKAFATGRNCQPSQRNQICIPLLPQELIESGQCSLDQSCCFLRDESRKRHRSR